MNTWVIGDLHLGHKNVCRFRTEFATPELHDQFIMDSWSTAIRKGGDRIYVMGDAAFTWEALEKIGKLPGEKRLVRGNHDTQPTAAYLAVFSAVYGLLQYKGAWLSHAPIHPTELRGLLNVHGHVHDRTLQDPRYINACPEVIGYAPVPLPDLIRKRLALIASESA